MRNCSLRVKSLKDCAAYQSNPKPSSEVVIIWPSTNLKVEALAATCHFLNEAAVPSKSGVQPAPSPVKIAGDGRISAGGWSPGAGNFRERKSAVRRARATPVSIGLGEPSVGNKAGAAT